MDKGFVPIPGQAQPSTIHYGGHCAHCGRWHGLPLSSEAAEAARSLLDEVAALAQVGSIESLAGEERLLAQGASSAHQPGGGRMLGLAVCRTGRGEHRTLRAFSGLWEGRTNLEGWVPPVALDAGEAAWKRAGEARLAELNSQLAMIESGLQGRRSELRHAQAAQLRRATKERAALAGIHRISRARRRQLRAEMGAETGAETGAESGAETNAEKHPETSKQGAALNAESRADKRALRDLKAQHRQEAAGWADALTELDAPLRPLLRARREFSRRMMRRIHRETMIASYGHGDMPLERVFLAEAAAPTGAGDCCAPKLIQAAIRLGWQIESMAEIWLGAAPASGQREHGSLHGACAEKCQPLLGFMLCGLPAAMSLAESSVPATSETARSLPDGRSATREGRSSTTHPGLPGSVAPRASRGDFVPPDMRAVELPLLYHDPHFVIVDKPSGLLSVPGRGLAAEDCVIARIRARYPGSEGPMMVHRLDMDCSGLMLVALNAKSQRSLSMQFASRQVTKHYVALLEGPLDGTEGEIELAFRLDPADRPRQIYDPERGKLGISRWRRIAIETGPDGKARTRVHFEPITGRTHQLRLHASHPDGLGLPIVGDRLYGCAERGFGRTEGRAKDGNLRFGDPAATAPERLMLHACLLTFRHPDSGEQMRFDAPAPF
jgi:tRNA pseudouridine32 synthase/23S rRNA pseudouridine746 synthase